MKLTGIELVDSSAWLAYYFGESDEVKNIIDSDALLLTSSLSLFEIRKKLLKLNKDPIAVLNFIKQRSGIIVPTIRIVEKAADIAIDKKLGAIDAMIYTSARLNNARLLTCDNDFRELEYATIV